MLYLVNDAIATSVWFYNAFFQEGGGQLPEGERCETPTGFANFPGEKVYKAPPKSWVERAYNLVHWRDMPKGGHFAAMKSQRHTHQGANEEPRALPPAVLRIDVRRTLRQGGERARDHHLSHR